jgi:peptide/nickel transport system permease protein
VSVAEAEAAELSLEDQSGLWRDAFERLRRNPGAIAGALIIVAFAAVAVFAPALAPHGPNQQVGRLAAVPPGPSAEFPLGLDQQGRDVLSRIIFGARLSLLVGVVSAGVGLTIGMVLGSVAGYFGRWVDTAVMRTMDLMLAVPQFLLALAIVTALGPGLVQIMVAVGIANVPQFARLLRGSILAQREADYVLAARSLGAPGRRLLLAHILPNSIAPVIVQGTLAMATAIIDVAGLSFLGLGPADPRLTEWGKMVAENAGRLESAPHLVLFPGFAIVISVLGLNLIGDGLREALDPKLKS